MQEKLAERAIDALQPVLDYASASAKSFLSGGNRIAFTFCNNHWTKTGLTLVECWPESGKFVEQAYATKVAFGETFEYRACKKDAALVGSQVFALLRFADDQHLMMCVENRAIRSTVHSAFLFGGRPSRDEMRAKHDALKGEGYVVLHEGLVQGTCIEVKDDEGNPVSVVAYVTN
jgi:hypothetical protein